MVLHHREELQDQIETIQRFAVSYIYKPVIIDQLVAVFSRFSEVNSSTNTVVRWRSNYRILRMDVEHHKLLTVARRWLPDRREATFGYSHGSKKVLTVSSYWKVFEAMSDETNIVDVYIRYLRSKLDVKGSKATLVRGVGYTMQE